MNSTKHDWVSLFELGNPQKFSYISNIAVIK